MIRARGGGGGQCDITGCVTRLISPRVFKHFVPIPAGTAVIIRLVLNVQFLPDMTN